MEENAIDIKKLNILIVEDEHFQRMVLTLLLKKMGINHIEEASDGASAIDIIKNRATSLDIIICDLSMPGMDGMELIRHIGEANLRVAVIIASALEPTLLRAIETMAQNYGVYILGMIEKPTTMIKLDPLIQKYMVIKINHLPKKRIPQRFVISRQDIALGLKNEEFEPFFQPKIDMVNRSIKGVEALARWKDPKKGILTPNYFIPQMEAEGLIDALTWMLLKKSVEYSKAWRKSGLDVIISINLSISSLTNINFADQVIAFLDEQVIEPSMIIFEITESATTTHFGSVLENLVRLRVHGYGLSIDDYGTGYSSMQQLMRIPYTELKIDQSFIANTALYEYTRVIVRSSLEMAKKLKMISVAEGIETQEDWNLLSSLGCDLAQGHFISKPISGDQFYNWALAWPNSEIAREARQGK